MLLRSGSRDPLRRIKKKAPVSHDIRGLQVSRVESIIRGVGGPGESLNPD